MGAGGGIPHWGAHTLLVGKMPWQTLEEVPLRRLSASEGLALDLGLAL